MILTCTYYVNCLTLLFMSFICVTGQACSVMGRDIGPTRSQSAIFPARVYNQKTRFASSCALIIKKSSRTWIHELKKKKIIVPICYSTSEWALNRRRNDIVKTTVHRTRPPTVQRVSYVRTKRSTQPFFAFSRK